MRLLADLLDLQPRDHWQRGKARLIEPDWVLIYCVDGEVVRLERTGTHADLFGK